MDKSIKFVGLSSIKFKRQFKDESNFYEYLASIKWADETFECKKCKYKKYCIGEKPFSRRCLKCRYDEVQRQGLCSTSANSHY